MKINRIHIDNFGKLSDLDLDLKDGINTLLENNGWGKSTLVSFIRIMFYGMNGDGKKKNLRENDRKLYSPWNGNTFGGSIEFETSKGKYELTRTFGAQEKNDTFSLIDIVTNKESKEYSQEDIGEKLFGIDADSYRKTSYISHDGIKYTGAGSEISSRISASPQGEDIANYDRAQEKMKDYLNSHSPQKVNGSLSRQKSEISALEQVCKRKPDLEKRLSDEKKNLSEICETIKGLKGRKKVLEDNRKSILRDKEKALGKQTYFEKKNELERRKKTSAEILESLGGSLPGEDRIGLLREKTEEIERLSAKAETVLSESMGERFERLKAKFGDSIPDRDELQTHIDEMEIVSNMVHGISIAEEQIGRDTEELERVRRENAEAAEIAAKEAAGRSLTAKRFILIGIILILITAAVLAAFLLHSLKVPEIPIYIIAAVLFAAGIVFIATGAVRKKAAQHSRAFTVDTSGEIFIMDKIEALKKEKRDREAKQKNAEESVRAYLAGFDIEYCRADAETILYSIKSDSADYREMLKEEAVRKNAADELMQKGRNLAESIRSDLLEIGAGIENEIFFPGRYSEIKSILEELRSKTDRYRASTAETERAERELVDFFEKNPDFDPDNLPDTEDSDSKSEMIEAELENITVQFDEKSRERDSAYRRIEDLENELEDLGAQSEELETRKEQYEAEKKQYDIVSVTKELLTEAKDSLVSRYMAPLRCSFEKYYDILKDSCDKSEGKDYLIDTNLEIRKKELGNYRDIAAMSDGYGDIVGLCMRAAFLDVMYKDEKPVVLMDDPFSNLDEDNIRWGGRFLELLAENYQIIYLTCHNDRVSN